MNEQRENEVVETSEDIETGIEEKNEDLSASSNQKGGNKKFIIAGIIAVVVIVAILAIVVGNTISVTKEIGRLEDAIYSIPASGYDEDEVIRLYEEYDSLSDSNKRKVANRSAIIEKYQEVQALIENRKKAAKEVDAVIRSIDSSNIYAKASTVKDAVIAYNSLDEKEKEYLQSEEALQKAYNEVKDMNLEVTPDNFLELFAIEYAVGEKVNNGGSTVVQHGYNINWNKYGGSITPDYDIEETNDYYIPVYVYVAARYPNLTSDCSFHINLHQTYNGLGIVDSDVHEFKLQSRDIYYDSSMGVGEYLICVEDKDATNSLLSYFGWSYDWSDWAHEMNEFDASRIKISELSGSVSYK